MAYRISPIWLMVLYSIAGFTETEIAELSGWSLKAIERGLKQWEIAPSDNTPKGQDIRRFIETIRVKQGNTAALHAIRKLLEEVAGPPIRVYR